MATGTALEYLTRLVRILSKWRYEPRLRATPRKRVVYEPRALSSVPCFRLPYIYRSTLQYGGTLGPHTRITDTERTQQVMYTAVAHTCNAILLRYCERQLATVRGPERAGFDGWRMLPTLGTVVQQEPRHMQRASGAVASRASVWPTENS